MLVYSHFYSIRGMKFLRHEISLSNLMKIFIQSPEKLTDSDLKEIVDLGNRKGRQLAVQTLIQSLIS